MFAAPDLPGPENLDEIARLRLIEVDEVRAEPQFVKKSRCPRSVCIPAAPDPFAVVLVSNHQLFESGEIQVKLAALAQCFDRFDEDEIRCAGAETRGCRRRKDEKFSRFKMGGRLQSDLSEMRDRILATGGHFFELLENKAIEAIARVGRARVKRQHHGTDGRYR